MARNNCLVLCLVVAACASVSGRDRRISVVEAERAFAADAQVRTVNEAFIRAFAPDAIIFRPTPLNAPQIFATRPFPPTMSLRWTPTTAETSAAGDLGVTSGPAEWGTRGAPPTGTGYFLSVWRADDKNWKVVFDAGTEGPIPAPIAQISTISIRTLQPSPSRSDDLDQMRNDILHLERQLIEDYPTRFREHAASDVRLFRNGRAPTATVGDAVGVIREEGDITWNPQASFVSKSGDLGYVYGVAKDSAAAGYVRIWRNQDGNWRIAYDLQ